MIDLWTETPTLVAQVQGCFDARSVDASKYKGYEDKLVIEGSAVTQVKELADADKPFANLYAKAKEAGLVDCVCKACANKMGSLEAALEQGLPLCDSMSGHPPMSDYLEKGYQVIAI